ncbi:MAG TPA: D-alanyl-D-alanine carboxypeptidase family protein [Actinomycetota bacterium]
MRSRTAEPAAVPKAFVAAVLAMALLGAVGTVPSIGVASTPPPTPVPPHGSPSPFPTALRTPTPSAVPPKLTSPSAVLEDLRTGQVLYAKKADLRRPIASITKIMTALVVLEEASPGEEVVVSAKAAGTRASQLGLVTGERISVRQLLYALLMQSANDAAVALAEHVGGSVAGFVELMNRKAEEIGIHRTHFVDPAGLEDRGNSTAKDVAAVVRAAYMEPLFARITRTKFHKIPAPSGRARRIQNRNILLWLYPGAIGAKTGFTTPAQHCLVAAADRAGVRLVAVALGSRGDDAAGVFDDGAALLNFGYEAFQQTVLVARGQTLGRVTVEGQRVDAVAGDELIKLVRKDQIPNIFRAFLPDTGLFLPVVAGQRVGEELVVIAGKRAGRVEAVAIRTVFRPTPRASPSPELGPLRTGSLAAALRLLAAVLKSLLDAFL